MVFTILVLMSYSLPQTRSSFTCKVDFQKDYYEFVLCSMSGVGMRLDMTRFWIVSYLFLIIVILIGGVLGDQNFFVQITCMVSYLSS